MIQIKVIQLNGHNSRIQLTSDWYEHVDVLVLDDMNEHWGISVDPAGKFGVHETIRQTLKDKWTKKQHGWALRSDPRDIIYEFSEFDEWRDAFEDRQETKQEHTHGVGLFGI